MRQRARSPLFLGIAAVVVAGAFAPGTRALDFEAPFLAVPTGRLPAGVACGDLDGDGRTDLVAANAAEDFATVALASAAGGFEVPVELEVGAGPVAVALADWDADGALDLAVACRDAQHIALRRGLGDGTFDSPFFLAAPPGPLDVRLADLDGDTLLDLVTLQAGAGAPSGTVSFWRATSPGVFEGRIDLDGSGLPAALDIADLDRDGAPDLVLLRWQPAALLVFWNAGDASFDARSEEALSGEPLGLACGDWNADGASDVAWTSERVELGSIVHRIGVRLGRPDRTLEARPEVIALGFALDLVAGDLDADGSADLVVAGALVAVHRGQGDGRFGLPRPFDAGSEPVAIVLADVTGTAALDAVVAASESFAVAVLPGRGDGTFGTPPLATAALPQSVAVARWDADAWPDLAFPSPILDAVVVHRGLGGAAFDHGTPYAVAAHPSCLASADLDGDGATDWVTASFADSSGMLTVLLGDGAGGARERHDTALAGPATCIAIDDFDRDGRRDVAAGISPSPWPQDGAVQLLLGLGTGSFQDAGLQPVGPLPMGIAAGDMDGDSLPDLAVTFRRAPGDARGGVTLLGGDGGGGFARRDELTGLEPRGVALADVDGDGRLDLAIAHSHTPRFEPGRVALYRGSGDGSFALLAEWPAGVEPYGIALPDLDGDGVREVVATNASSHTLGVWRAGATGFAAAARLDLGTGVRPLQVAAADLDGDGRPDLVCGNSGQASATILRQLSGPSPVLVDALDAWRCPEGACLSWGLPFPASWRAVHVSRAPRLREDAWERATRVGLVPLAAMRFVDPEDGASGALWYRLELVSDAGEIVRSGPVPLRGLADPEPGVDLEARVEPGGRVRISYRLPRSAAALDLAVHDVAGRRVRWLHRGVQSAGAHTFLWDASGDSGQRLARGVYWIRLRVGGATRVARFVLAAP